MTLVRNTLWIQSSYILITAVWPILDIKSFMLVTGPKNDIWLVKTVGALLIPVALSLASYLFLKTDLKPAIILGGSTAIAFIFVDFYYSLTDVIRDIYMVDGLLEIIFLVCWIIIAFRDNQSLKK